MNGANQAAADTPAALDSVARAPGAVPLARPEQLAFLRPSQPKDQGRFAFVVQDALARRTSKVLDPPSTWLAPAPAPSEPSHSLASSVGYDQCVNEDSTDADMPA